MILYVKYRDAKRRVARTKFSAPFNENTRIKSYRSEYLPKMCVTRATTIDPTITIP